MPLIAYTCEQGHTFKKFFRKTEDIVPESECPYCKSMGKKQLSAPSQSSKITIDNGIQGRAVEVLPDIVEINENRANKDYHKED